MLSTLAANAPMPVPPTSMHLGPHFDTTIRTMLSTIKQRLAEQGAAWPTDWPDPDRTPIGTVHGGSRPSAPDMRPIMASMAPLWNDLADSKSAGLKYLQLMLPTLHVTNCPS